MATSAEKMAAKLESSGRRKDAVGVRARARVLKQPASDKAEPTVGELIRLGAEAQKVAASRGCRGAVLRGSPGEDS